MALDTHPPFTLFDRWGGNLGRLSYMDATHTEALDGTDELKVTCERALSKGQRIVWVDRQGVAHEHIVDEVSQIHEDAGMTYCEATCINSIAELLDDYVEDKRPSGGVAETLTSILSGTRWEVGTCDQKGSASHTFYHISAREALSDLVSTWGGELEVEIETDGVTVTHRRIGIRAARGNQDSPKRFTWTKDIIDIKRITGSSNPKTRVYGYGKGVETDTGGYGRRLTFGDINDGKDYVEDAAATAIWGHPDGAGGVLPAVDTYVNEQCEDAEQLLAETMDYLETVKEPTVSYEANVLDLCAYGRSWEGVSLGDCVAIIDKQFAENGIRLKGRVSQIERNLVTAETTVTFGNLVDALADMWETVAGALKSGAASRANYDAVANPSVGWLTLLQSALNKQFNAVGTYKVESFELGQIFSNVALNPETGAPVKTTADMWAVNINGMGIRLAASLTAAGEWDWTTFITGASVNADCINVGTLRANLIKAGILTDLLGKNFWNFDTGEFSLSSSAATLDGKSIATTQDVVDLDTALDQEEVLNRLSGGSTECGVYLYEGKLYINGTFIKSGVVDAGLVKAGKLLVMDKTTGKTVFSADIDAGTCYIGGDSVQIGGAALTDEINSINSDVAASGTKYGYCYTAAATAAKTATISDFKLQKGATVAIKFSYANSADKPTLNVSDTGNKQIAYAGYSYLLEKHWWKAGDLITLTYDGTYWQVADSASRKNARTIWASDTTAATVTAGTVTFNSNTFICNANNLKVSSSGIVTASSFTATGAFTGGSTSSGYGMKLGTDGCLRGYRNGSEVGRLDPTSSVYYIPTGETLYGMQLYGKQVIREVSPHVSALASSSTSATSTRCTTGSGTFIYKITYDKGSGTTTWYYETLSFINGRLTSELSS
jgi:phage minor structural protein